MLFGHLGLARRLGPGGPDRAGRARPLHGTRRTPATGEAGDKIAGATLVDNPFRDLVHYLLSR